jgi:hypothetical protein
MTTRLRLILSALPCTSGIVLGQDVKYSYDPGVDFSKYHWQPLAAVCTPYPGKR